MTRYARVSWEEVTAYTERLPLTDEQAAMLAREDARTVLLKAMNLPLYLADHDDIFAMLDDVVIEHASYMGPEVEVEVNNREVGSWELLPDPDAPQTPAPPTEPAEYEASCKWSDFLGRADVAVTRRDPDGLTVINRDHVSMTAYDEPDDKVDQALALWGWRRTGPWTGGAAPLAPAGDQDIALPPVVLVHREHAAKLTVQAPDGREYQVTFTGGGRDNALVLYIDSEQEPTADRLRINVNDAPAFNYPNELPS